MGAEREVIGKVIAGFTSRQSGTTVAYGVGK